MKLDINGTVREVDATPDMPLLWVLRDVLGLHRHEVRLRHGPVRRVHRPPRRPAGALVRHAGLDGRRAQGHARSKACSADGSHPVQRAWAEADVVQCGYCQSGQIMTAVALLEQKPDPSDADIDAAMSGNICRCGTYVRVREAIHLAAKLSRGGAK